MYISKSILGIIIGYFLIVSQLTGCGEGERNIQAEYACRKNGGIYIRNRNGYVECNDGTGRWYFDVIVPDGYDGLKGE